MREPLYIILVLAVFFAGCAGRRPHPVQIHQLGDEQKSCQDLQTEMVYIKSEIARLLPESNKTDDNNTLGTLGFMLVVPLFSMDFKQGEKQEIGAYQQRYNHLLTLSQQKNCKLPPPADPSRLGPL